MNSERFNLEDRAVLTCWGRLPLALQIRNRVRL